MFAEHFRAAGYRVLHEPFRREPGFFASERRLMLAGHYDVIHLHTEQANFWHGLVAASVHPATLLRTIHNTFAFDGRLRWRRGWQRRVLQRIGVRHVAVSDSVMQNETARYRIRPVLISNWYDSDRFNETSPSQRSEARATFGFEGRAFVIACIGNCSAVKNHATLVRAIATLEPDRRPILLHAGAEDPSRSEYQLAAALGVLDRVRFLGPVRNVLPLLRAADAFVMPSLFEGFGIAAAEALATGLPAVLSDVAGLREFRRDFPGLIYTGTGTEDWASGLLRMMSVSDQQRREMHALYPQQARHCFGMERGVHDYGALYRSGDRSQAMAHAEEQGQPSSTD
jgi:glycosyltransferase involved in cell wall biosynthesis